MKDDEDDEDDEEGGSRWRAALPHLDAALAELPAGDQEVILQRFYNDQSFASNAALMNKKEAAVQKQARRALDKLCKLLKRGGIAVPPAGNPTTC